MYCVEKERLHTALFFFPLRTTISRGIGTVDAEDGSAQPIVFKRTKDSLVFRGVKGILVSNDASADATICRAVP
jgi:hypothetical protein